MAEQSPAGKVDFDEERWAATSARLLRLVPEAAKAELAKRKIDPEVWRAHDARFTRAMAAELGRGEVRLAELYAAACAAEMKRRNAPAPLEDASPKPPARLRPPTGRSDEQGPLSVRRPPQAQGPLTLNEYALFVAEVVVFPEKQEEVMARNGLTDLDAQRRMDQAFQAWFESQPQAREEWIALCTGYQEDLRQRGR